MRHAGTRLARTAFDAWIAEALGDPDLAPALAPFVRLIGTIEEELARIDRSMAAMAEADETCRLLMPVPRVATACASSEKRAAPGERQPCGPKNGALGELGP